jgi:enamine deaminase RidA (YjgF/YER057c/UK114 family)
MSTGAREMIEESTMADREYLHPEGVHRPPEPYSHAIRCGDLLIMAGQVAIDESGEVVGIDDPEAQFRQVWKNIQAAVESAGGAVQDIVKLTYYVRDVRFIEQEIPIRQRLFPDGKFPCTTVVGVRELGLPTLLMEVDAWAHIPGK